MDRGLSLAHQEKLHDFRGDLPCTFIQLRFREIGNGVGHGQELIVRKPPGLGHRPPRFGEDIRNNGDSRNTIFFKENSIEHTARTA